MVKLAISLNSKIDTISGSPKIPIDTILGQNYLIRNWSAQKLTLNRGLTLFCNDTIGGSTVLMFLNQHGQGLVYHHLYIQQFAMRRAVNQETKTKVRYLPTSINKLDRRAILSRIGACQPSSARHQNLRFIENGQIGLIFLDSNST